MGRRHRPFYRINAVEARTPRDGRILEKLGHYDPIEKDLTKQIVLDVERIKFWLEQGAVASDTVAQIMANAGIKSKQYEEKLQRRSRAREIARKQGKPFTKVEKAAAQQTGEAKK